MPEEWFFDFVLCAIIWGAPPSTVYCAVHFQHFELFQIDFEIYRWFVTASDYPRVQREIWLCDVHNKQIFHTIIRMYDTMVDWWSLITDCITHWLSCVISRNHGQQLNAFQRWWDGRKQQLNHRYTNESDEGFWVRLGQKADAITYSQRIIERNLNNFELRFIRMGINGAFLISRAARGLLLLGQELLQIHAKLKMENNFISISFKHFIFCAVELWRLLFFVKGQWIVAFFLFRTQKFDFLKFLSHNIIAIKWIAKPKNNRNLLIKYIYHDHEYEKLQ